MAKILKESLRPRPSYPWIEWQDGKAREAKRGKDFHVSAESFRSGVLTRAAATGMKAITEIIDADTVRFQFVEKGAK